MVWEDKSQTPYRNLISFLNRSLILIILLILTPSSLSGGVSFYRCSFDPTQGGEMLQQEYVRFLKIESNPKWTILGSPASQLPWSCVNTLSNPWQQALQVSCRNDAAILKIFRCIDVHYLLYMLYMSKNK